MKNRKKKGKTAVFLGTAALLYMMTGCGEAEGDTREQSENIIRIEDTEPDGGQDGRNGQSQQETEKDSGQNSEGESGRMTENEESETPGNAPADNQEADSDIVLKETESDTELEGSVTSVGENSIVVSKIHTYTDENSECAVAEIAVDYGDGVAGAELITVYFSENTGFIVRTVKNGGVNGDSDVTESAGTVSDIRENDTVIMTGGYEGADFHAEQVVIYNFI